MAGVSPATIGRVERDDPKVEVTTVIRAAERLGLRFDYETMKIVPPADLPPPAPPKRGMAGKKIIAVSPELYANLKHLAGSRTVEQYLADHVKRQGIVDKDVIPPRSGRRVDRGIHVSGKR